MSSNLQLVGAALAAKRCTVILAAKAVPTITLHTKTMPRQQRGVVLFFALIALVVMSLAAVALIRSTDTSTLISGNLAFKQSATSSGDGAFDQSNTWLFQQQTAASGVDPTLDAAHPLNNDILAAGYYTYMNDDSVSANYLNLFAPATWAGLPSITDASGNTSQYLIQRMCQIPNQLVSPQNCMFGHIQTNSPHLIQDSTGVGLGITSSSSVSGHPGYRITVRTTGPKNTLSYIQAFIY